MVTIKDKGSGLFAENTALCDGSTTESVANTYCFIPIVSLRLGSSDYDYELGDTPQFQIQAINERGYSPSSDANTLGASIQTEPIQMQSVLRNSATTENQIILDWSELNSPDNGDSEIIAYNLQWYKASLLSWVDLYGVLPSQIDTQFVLTSEVVPGESYSFKIRAANIHGFGDFSSVVSIKAAGIPSKVETVVTSIDPATGGVKIDWETPHDGQQSITDYMITIANQSGSLMIEDWNNCGGNDVSSTYCIMPMDTLTDDPYDLLFGDTVIAQVTAYNLYGPGPSSDLNTVGAMVRRVPDQMS